LKNRNRSLLYVIAVIVLSAALFAVAAASGYEFKEEPSEAVQDEITVTQSEEVPEWATRPAQERPEPTEEDLYYMNLRIDEPM